jgi:hypothetical protein
MRSKNTDRPVYKLEMHLGRLRYAAEIRLPSMISDLEAAIRDAVALLDDSEVSPHDKRVARRNIVKWENRLPTLRQRITDAFAEIDRLKQLTDENISEWYARRGWQMPDVGGHASRTSGTTEEDAMRNRDQRQDRQDPDFPGK